MSKYIDAEKLKAEITRLKGQLIRGACASQIEMATNCKDEAYNEVLASIDSLQQEQNRMRYCIEYINPQYPLLYNGMLHICHLRVPDEHSAEMALTTMLSLGARIYALYRGNAKEGKLGEWPTPMIVDAYDWYSEEWLRDILDRGSKL